MLLEALMWALAGAISIAEESVTVVVPDSWLAILRSALHGTGTPIVLAATYWLHPEVIIAFAVTFEIIVALYITRLGIRAIRGLRKFWGP